MLSAIRLYLLLCILPLATIGAQQNDRIQIKLDTAEITAVLSILDKRAAHQTVTEADWQSLFSTIPYKRLKMREQSFHRSFEDENFKKFVLTLDAQRAAFRQALELWEKADLRAAAQRTLQYLPSSASIRASIYPVIKPQSNSFVFEAGTDPAIFLYFDPKLPAAQFENTVGHELHHIGLASLDAQYEQRIQSLPENNRKAARWMGAFGEGIAVLAAAGSPDIPPIAAFPQRDQMVWEVDMEDVDSDLQNLNQFFLDVIHGDLRNDAPAHVGMMFFGFRGPWYTVGYLMATTIEKQFGRAALVATLGDPRQFVAEYNRAATAYNAKATKSLPLFSSEILQAVGAPPLPGSK